MNLAAQAPIAAGSGAPECAGSSAGASRSLGEFVQPQFIIEIQPCKRTSNGEWRRRADWSEDELGCRAWIVTKPSQARQGHWLLLFTPNVAPPHPRSERLA
jgi:hypothetical protein